MDKLLPSPTRRIVRQVATGAIVGAAATGLFLFLADGKLGNFADLSVALPVAAGLSYGLIGLFVALGVAAPRAGAALLNVEDEAEVREQRPMLSSGALACILLGLFMIELAVAPALAASLGPVTTGLIAGATLLALIVIWMRESSRMDELNKQLSLEATALGFNIACLLLGGLGILAALGRTIAIEPVTALAAIALVQLVAIFWVAGRRGLLAPRRA